MLRNVSFTIKAVRVLRSSGHTGAGKTTIISLLARFYDIQKGEILVDGIDIRQVTQADLRRHMAVVLQDVFLFSGDIAGNIGLGNETIPEDRLRAAARVVGAHRFIESTARAVPCGREGARGDAVRGAEAADLVRPRACVSSAHPGAGRSDVECGHRDGTR